MKTAIKILAMLVTISGCQLVWAGNPIFGGRLYTKHCASCHGANGRAVVAGTPDFSGGGSNILMKSDFQLIEIIKQGKGIMPAYRGTLSDTQISDIIAHARTLF